MIEEGIIARIKADTTVNSYINGRVYPHQIIQGNTYPMVALVTNEQQPINGQGGMCIREYDFLLHVSSTSYLECLNIGEALITLFDRFRGTLGGLSASTCRYRGVAMNVKENDTELYHIAYEFNILININN